MVSRGPCCLSPVRTGFCRPWLAFLLLLSGVPVLRAAAPRDELLRFVPPSTGFCLVLQGLRTHWSALRESPFAEQLRKSGLAETVLSMEDRHKLDLAEKKLQLLGLDWTRLRDDLLGEALVFAFRPGPPGKAEQDQGLFLLRVQNAQTLADLIERFNDAQKKAGMLKELQECEHNGIKYFRRTSTRDVAFYLVRGPILLLTSQEEMLQQALDQERTLPPEAEPPLTRQLKELSADRALLALWVNPRALDAAMTARATQLPPAETAAVSTVAAWWKAVEGVVLSLQLDRDLSLSLALRARTEQLPPVARTFLAQAGQPSDLARLFPDDALLTVTGRLDLAALLGTIGEFLSPKGRQTLQGDLNRTLGATLGRNFVKEILPFLGPDLGLCVTAPAEQDRSWLPQGLLALRVGEGNPAARADQAAFTVVQMLAHIAIFAHNAQRPEHPIELKTRLVGKQEIRYIAGNGVFPPGVQPAFALQNGYLVLASSPDLIQRFGQPQPGNPPARGPGQPILRISFKAWRTYLQQRRSDLVEAMTANKELARPEASRKLDGLVEWLQMLDRLELRQQTGKGQLILTLTLQPSLALRK